MSTTKTNVSRVSKRSAIVSTPAGAVKITFHGHGLAVVSTNEAGDIQPNHWQQQREDTVLEIRGVEYSGRVDLRSPEREKSQRQNPHGPELDTRPGYLNRTGYFYMSRPWRQGKDDRPSTSARGKLVEIAEQAAREALAAFPELETEGEAEALESARATLRDTIARLKTELAEAQAELVGLLPDAPSWENQSNR